MRTALSARLDAEDTGLTQATLLDDHLAGCADCRAWQAAAEQVTLIIRQPMGVPDLTAPILAAVAQQRQADFAGRKRILQIALGLSAVVQLALAIPGLLVAGVDLHTSREAASFDIALAVGFALAAWWPERARAFVPVAFVLAGCLTLTSAFDIAAGATLVAHEISHVAALAQAGLLLALSRRVSSGRASAPRQVTVA
ncbi:zf-HC2 domain-containing protein [Rhizocola hellebori]|nr:zf-HC2 domain-containing protein [Rhizocola hellebori]